MPMVIMSSCHHFMFHEQTTLGLTGLLWRQQLIFCYCLVENTSASTIKLHPLRTAHTHTVLDKTITTIKTLNCLVFCSLVFWTEELLSSSKRMVDTLSLEFSRSIWTKTPPKVLHCFLNCTRTLLTGLWTSLTGPKTAPVMSSPPAYVVLVEGGSSIMMLGCKYRYQPDKVASATSK